MSIIRMFDASQLLDLCVSISIAFVLATLIGAERQWRQRNAGLRTNVLVAVGAAAFVTLGMNSMGKPARSRSPPTSCLVSGFLVRASS